MQPIKILVVGCGKVGERHLLAYKNIKGVDVVVCDLNEKLAMNVGSRYGVRWLTDYLDALESGTFDAIDVCTPTFTHYDVVMKGLEHNLHVFCEKPLAESVEKIKKIYEEALRADRIVMVGYLYRHYPSMQFVKKVLDEGVLGRPYYAIFRLGGRGGHRVWKHRKETCGGTIFEMMTHMIDLALWFFGDIKEAKLLHENVILKKRLIEGRIVDVNAEDVAVALFKTEGDVELLCESDLITPSYNNIIEIQADNGSIFSSILHYIPTILYLKENRGIYNRGPNFYNFPRINVFEKELKYFIDCIRSGKREVLNGVDDSIKIARVIETLKGS